ncbi:MAG: CaiB/BaiF CoA transferase family protein [Hyphomonadaceae bacterium]
MSDAQTADAAMGPCKGLRVIDLTSVLAGPFCGRLLADLGAEVIKVESPGSDLSRLIGPSLHGVAAGFEQFNHGKKSLSVNLKDPNDLAAVRALIEGADIFLHNSRPGVMERLGLGWETLQALNPRLVYGVISGFGEDGPYAGRPAYDGLVQGLTGFMHVQGGEDGPAAILTSLVDKITSVFGANALLAAIIHRDRTGEGQKVVVSLLSAYTAFVCYDMMMGYVFKDLGFQNIQPPAVPTYRLLDTADGKVIGLVLQQKQFEGFCAALERTDLLDDPRFATAPLRSANLGLLYDEVRPQTTKLSTAALLALMVKHDAPFAPINTIEQFFEDPQVKHIQGYLDFDDPEFGTIRHLNHPASFEKTPLNMARRAPKLGEHNSEILARVAAVKPKQQ